MNLYQKIKTLLIARSHKKMIDSIENSEYLMQWGTVKFDEKGEIYLDETCSFGVAHNGLIDLTGNLETKTGSK